MYAQFFDIDIRRLRVHAHTYVNRYIRYTHTQMKINYFVENYVYGNSALQYLLTMLLDLQGVFYFCCPVQQSDSTRHHCTLHSFFQPAEAPHSYLVPPVALPDD